MKYFKKVIFAGVFLSISVGLANAEVVLQPHQKASVDYLMKNPEKKGLLLFHSLGSGKTYIALGYAEKNPEKKVLILLPEFLKSNWLGQMESFGVKNPSRYEFISLNETDKILGRDLSHTIVIVDEVHKWIQQMRLNTPVQSEKLIEAYFKIKSADKLILLTGTPIFIDTSDISYIANLLLDDEPFPVDSMKFKTEFMKIKPVTSLVRGHITESKLMLMAVPFFMTFTALVTLGTAMPLAVPLVALGGGAAIPVLNEVFPANQVSFREFDAQKWKDFCQNYVSFYNVKFVSNENYPTKKIVEKPVEYNELQANFFLNFIDEDMSIEQIHLMLADQNQNLSDQYLKFHSTIIQKQLLANTSSGMEIGNLEFKGKNNEWIESPKFLEILKIIQLTSGQVVVYSNYFNNGIKKFFEFLERKGLKQEVVLLSPGQSTQEQTDVLEQYNKNKKRILLIHPEITEGISLIGTEQLHILEPVENSALLDQIIGRTVRFRSHIHFPKEKQVVHVYLWESNIDYSSFLFPKSVGLVRREHWQKKYSEINPSMWSKGILEVDNNYFLKNETPDLRVKRHRNETKKDLESLKDLLNKFSIEKPNTPS